MSIFYENYVRLCNQVGKSPSGVALEIGLSKTAVNGWKHGRSNPTDATVQRVAAFFNVEASELLIPKSENKPAAITGTELDIKDIINTMSREELVEFILIASARLKELD